MFRMFCALLMFLLASLNAREAWNFEGELKRRDGPLFVSLGSWCDFAMALRVCGFRDAAFPFDWLVTYSNQGLIDVLDEDFEYFTAESCFIKLYNVADQANPLQNSCYDMMFYHEWYDQPEYEWSDVEKFKQQMEYVQAKYARRIERFRALRNYPGKVIFLRNPWWMEEIDQSGEIRQQAEALRAALDRYFPALDFTLAIVKFTKQKAPSIGSLEGVVEYEVEREHAEIQALLQKIAQHL